MAASGVFTEAANMKDITNRFSALTMKSTASHKADTIRGGAGRFTVHAARGSSCYICRLAADVASTLYLSALWPDDSQLGHHEVAGE